MDQRQVALEFAQTQKQKKPYQAEEGRMRKIEQKMIDYIDKKLAENGLAQEHIANKNMRGLMVEAAKACVGIREATGKNDGPMVELIQETVGGHSREFWCMSFVQTIIAYAEVKTGIKSKVPAGEYCTTIFKQVKKDNPELLVKFNPLAGAIIIWQHGDTSAGHTGIVLDCDEDIFFAVEGNASGFLKLEQAQSGSVNRNGNGVFYAKRNRKGDGDMKVIGFIKPI